MTLGTDSGQNILETAYEDDFRLNTWMQQLQWHCYSKLINFITKPLPRQGRRLRH